MNFKSIFVSFFITTLVFLFTLAPSAYAAVEVIAAANSIVNNWSYSTTSTDGVTAFVSGPGMPLIGTGSFQLSTGTRGDLTAELNNSGYLDARLQDIVNFSYSTYATSAPGNNLPFVVMYVDTHDSGIFDVLLFRPKDNPTQGTPTLNTWQSWNATTGVWFSTQTSFGFQTLQDYVTLFPNATVGAGGISFRVGTGASTDIFNGYVDNFAISADGADTIYDFEYFVVTCALADVNDDNVVDLSDTLLILGKFGMNNEPVYDMDANGEIDLTDALLNLDHFGETCDHL